MASPYNGGLLINEKPATGSPYVQFTNANPGTPIATLHGSPITNVNVTVTQGADTTTYSGIQAMFDSGGVDGTIPFNAPTGSTVTVYDPSTSLPLYTYTVGVNYSPIAAAGLMNTGAAPFLQNPVYISYAGRDDVHRSALTVTPRAAEGPRLPGKRIEHVSRIDAELSGYMAGVPILAPAQRPLCASGISGRLYAPNRPADLIGSATRHCKL